MVLDFMRHFTQNKIKVGLGENITVDWGKQLVLGRKEPKHYLFKIKTKLISDMEP